MHQLNTLIHDDADDFDDAGLMDSCVSPHVGPDDVLDAAVDRAAVVGCDDAEVVLS